MTDRMSLIGYKSINTVTAESVYQFLHGFMYGGAWGCVTPFPAPGSVAAAQELKTGIFKPMPPFSSLRAVSYNAMYVGSLLGYQRLCSKSLELIRRKEDITNDIFGFAMIYPYYRFVLNHAEKRLLLHHRIVSGSIILSILYTNIFV